MSFSGIFSVVLAMGIKDLRKKILLLLMGGIFIVSMTYSGTRTAVAMTVVGITFYGFLTLHRRSTLVLGVLYRISYTRYYVCSLLR